MVVKEQIQGIDIPIGHIKDYLIDNLSGVGNIKIYGRCFRNLTNEGYEPKVYLGNGEYEEPFINDRSLIAYFIDSNDHRSQNNSYFTTDVSIVFVLNLQKLSSSRNDSYWHSELRSMINKVSRSFFEIQSLRKGYENVMQGFDLSKYKHLDIQPYHIFSFNGTMQYYLNKRC